MTYCRETRDTKNAVRERVKRLHTNLIGFVGTNWHNLANRVTVESIQDIMTIL
jgi:hypothetical protein